MALLGREGPAGESTPGDQGSRQRSQSPGEKNAQGEGLDKREDANKDEGANGKTEEGQNEPGQEQKTAEPGGPQTPQQDKAVSVMVQNLAKGVQA